MGCETGNCFSTRAEWNNYSIHGYFDNYLETCNVEPLRRKITFQFLPFMAYFKTDWQYESDIRDGHLVSLLKAKPLFPLLRSNQGWPYSGSFNYHTSVFRE